MHRVAHRAARFVRGSRHARGTVDNPTSSLSFYPQGSTYPGRFSVQTIGATSYQGRLNTLLGGGMRHIRESCTSLVNATHGT